MRDPSQPVVINYTWSGDATLQQPSPADILLRSGALTHYGVDSLGNAEAPTTAYYESIDGGYSIFGAVLEGDVYNNIEGIGRGLIRFAGNSPREGLGGTPTIVGNKAAALKLGLYSKHDIWSTPLQTYQKKLQDIVKDSPRQDNIDRVFIETLSAEIELLKLQYQEYKQSLGRISGDIQALQYRETIRKAKREVARLRKEMLQREDEEILLLLL